MENYFLNELIKAVRGEFLIGDPHSLVNHISIDSRTLKKGDFYIALTGKKFDGHDFLKQVLEKKAAGLIISRKDIDLGTSFPLISSIVQVDDTTLALGRISSSYRMKWDIPLIAVTGSNGKTTTKEMLASILRQEGTTLSTSGNFNNQIGLPLTLLNLNSEHKYAVIEMGTSYPGEINQLAKIACPTMAILTNIGSSHLENFKNEEGVFEEKRALIDNLPNDGIVFINKDDKFLSTLAAAGGRQIITYGLNNKCDVYASDIRLWPDKPSFKLNIESYSMIIQLPVYGKFNIYNALAAAAAAWKLGISYEKIKKGLESFTLPDMRMQVHELMTGTVIINDAYNANPSSVKESIESFVQTFPDRSKIAVLADMLELGSKSEKEHMRIGEFLASQPLGHIFLFGPMMKKALPALRNVSAKHFSDKHELFKELKKFLNTGGIIFFKGSRGMNLETVITKLISEERNSESL